MPISAMVQTKKLLVIDPAVETPETEGTAEILAGWQGEAQVLQPALRPADGPAPGFDYELAGVVVMGSAASPLDQESAWLRKLSAWLVPIVTGEVELPLLGICFSHQLMAHLAGAEVGFLRADRQKQLGFCDTDMAGGRLITDCRLRVIISHREVVKTVPSGFRVVGSRPGVPIDAIEHRHLPLFGVQFHPEARGDFCRTRGLDFDPVADRVRRDGNLVLAAFRDLVESRADASRCGGGT
jgi:GMP synthase-like glutamine amidotransferase